MMSTRAKGGTSAASGRATRSYLSYDDEVAFVVADAVARKLGRDGHRATSSSARSTVDGSAGYDLVSKDSEGLAPGVFGVTARGGSRSLANSRDVLAAVDFAVCTAAQTFVGNSVSTFSAHQLLRRARARARQRRLPGGATRQAAARVWTTSTTMAATSH